MKPRILTPERAQGLVEYALIILLVALVVIVGLSILGSGLANGWIDNIVSAL